MGRRRFLLGSAGLMVMTACGGDGEGGRGGAVGSPSTAAVATELTVNLGQLFDPTAAFARVGVEQRLTFGLFDFEGAPLADEPTELSFELALESPAGATEPARRPLDEPAGATFHTEGLPRGYYPVHFTPDEAGTWSATTEVEGQQLRALFEVGPEGGPGVHEVGQPVPSFDTPTVEDALGVEPICTRAEQCPFHDLTFADALTSGAPVVLSVSTPAYCQVAICGPVLDLLVDAAVDYPGVTFVHAEPFVRPTPSDPFGAGVTAAMEAMGLGFEPSLFLVDATGTLAERLDNIYDLVELRDALDRLTS